MNRQSLLQIWMFLYLLFHHQSIATENELNQDGTTLDEVNDLTKFASKLADRLLSETNNLVSEKDALDIGTLIGKAANDPDTLVLIQRLKYGSGRDELEDFKDEQSKEQIVEGLKEVVSQLKLLEVLFNRNPFEALAELEKDGLVPEARLPEYRKNPELLEQDMRKGYYFSFVSLAVAGGYL